MKVKELRELSNEELQLELERVRRHLYDLRSQAVTEKLEDPSLLTRARRDKARILTVQQQRRAAGEAAQTKPNGKGA